MFDQVSKAFSNLVSKFKGKGQLSQKDLDKALKSTRNLLLQSDVALPVVNKLIARVKNAVTDHPSHFTPSEVLLNILNKEIGLILKQEEYVQEPIFPKVGKNLACCMLVGLQGAGKTTTVAKLAHRMASSHKPVLTSFDLSRYAAQEQLSNLANKMSVPFFFINKEKSLKQNVQDVIRFAEEKKATLLLVDTAGLSQIQTQLMDDTIQLKKILQPSEILLVLDSMTGQDSVQIGEEFHKKLSLTGIILSKSDGDTRGGAALSIRYITKCPIKYIGTGEKLEDLQIFHFKRIVSQILKQGDLETLKETLGDQLDGRQVPTADKFDINSMRDSFEQINKMGGMEKILKLMPGQMLEKARVPDNLLVQGKSIIDSMTHKERSNPKIINSSRKKRIAKGSGTSVVQINRLLKQYKQMKLLSKKSLKGGKLGGIPLN